MRTEILCYIKHCTYNPLVLLDLITVWDTGKLRCNQRREHHEARRSCSQDLQWMLGREVFVWLHGYFSITYRGLSRTLMRLLLPKNSSIKRLWLQLWLDLSCLHRSPDTHLLEDLAVRWAPQRIKSVLLQRSLNPARPSEGRLKSEELGRS